MAYEDLVFFDDFWLDLGDGVHNLSTDNLKCAVVDQTVTLLQTTSNPHWGATGTNVSAGELTGGSYTAGGDDLTVTVSDPWSITGDTTKFDLDDYGTKAQNASNPTTAFYLVLYNDTATNKPAIGYVDLGGSTDLTTGNLYCQWDASGLFTET